jgi:hypothetical protein
VGERAGESVGALGAELVEREVKVKRAAGGLLAYSIKQLLKG